jgi:hypothetical protein
MLLKYKWYWRIECVSVLFVLFLLASAGAHSLHLRAAILRHSTVPDPVLRAFMPRTYTNRPIIPTSIFAPFYYLLLSLSPSPPLLPSFHRRS